MAAVYCVAADLYAFGLPRGSVPNPGRIASADPAANAFTLGSHGFASGDVLSFRAESNGAMPAPLVSGVSYFALPLTDDTFQVAATIGGAPIDLTTPGTRIVVIAPLPTDAAIAFASRVIDDALPAHLVPLSLPVAEIVKMTCAELAAGKLMQGKGSASPSLGAMVDAATKRIARWALGVPVRGEHAPPPANVATSASLPFQDSRGWSQFGGIGGPCTGRRF